MISPRTCFRIAAIALSAAAFGVGCIGPAVGIDYKAPPTTAPESFQEVQPTTRPLQQVDLAHYWTTFKDPELNLLIDRAIKQNYTFHQAQMAVRQARAQLGVDIGAEFPTLTANLAATRTQTSKTASGATGVTSSGTTGTGTGTGTGATGAGNSSVISGAATKRQVSLFQGGFDAGWEIDIFGGGRRQIEEGADNVEATIDARRNALVTLTSEVAHDYVLLRGYQLQLEFANSNLKSEQDTLDLTNSRFKAGLTNGLDVAQAEASVYTTWATIPTLEIEIAQAEHALSILLSEPPMALSKELYVDTSPTAKNPIPPVPTDIPVGLPSELLRRRPDVRQAERQLASSTAAIGVAVANLFPKFSLTGSVGQESSRFGLIARDASSIWSIGPSVSWQILDYYQLQSEVRVTNAEQAQALDNYKAVVLQSFGDVEDALVAYAKEQNRLKLIDQEVAANQRAVDLSLQLYDRGLEAFLDVQTAERALYAAQSDQAVSRSNVAQDLVQLYKALGGGWDEAEEKQFENNEDPAIAVKQE
jgi:NodT family efflux transporter outer membrane factor (OMF) lipoprotein